MGDVGAAMRRLGLGDGPLTNLDARDVRAAYREQVRRHHPDVDPSPGASARTAELTAAYDLLRAVLADGTAHANATALAHGTAPQMSCAPQAVAELRVIADDTIEVDAPLDLTYSLLVQAAHCAGDVTFLDRSALVLQALVQFVDEPPCQVVFDLQGRAAGGTTEIFCTIESLEERPPPPIDAVTRFVADQLAQSASA